MYYRLLEPKNIAARIKIKIQNFGNPLYNKDEYSIREMLNVLYRFISKGLLPGGFKRIFLFLQSLPLTKPQLVPIVIKDWIIGLAMRDYVERHFVLEFEKVNQLANSYLKEIEA